MELRAVQNPTRGCGTLRKGGFYARGDQSPGGTLNAWSWVLGEHVIGGWNYSISVPARQMQVVHLPGTLVSGKMATVPLPLDDFPHLRNLPPVALLDHIGSQHYTPYSFFDECVKHGPSRRIPPSIAKAVAHHCPIPILFAHSELPCVDRALRGDLIDWSEADRERVTYEPTPFDVDWGITVDATFWGETHWMVRVLQQIDQRSGGKSCHLTKLMQPKLAENVLLSEQLYGVSWITRCVYIAQDGDTDETLENIFKLGIEPVRIVDE